MRSPFGMVIISLVAVIVLSTAHLAADPWLGDAQSVAESPNPQYRPAVGFNSVDDEYLVVWDEEDDLGISSVAGVRVGADGQVHSFAFYISDPAVESYEAEVAFDPVLNRYLVVWNSGYSGSVDVVGRFIPSGGPSPSYPEFTIASSSPDRFNPAVVHCPDLAEYLVVWENYGAASPNRIVAQRWAADGSGAITSELVITDAATHRAKPKVAWNSGVSEYLIVYEKTSAGGEMDIWATRLSWSGGVLGTEVGIAGWPGPEIEPDLATCRGIALVAWKGGVGTDSKVYSRLVHGDGTVGAIVSDLSGSESDHKRPAVSCSESGAEFLISWEGAYSFNRDVLAAFVEMDGFSGGSFEVYRSQGATLDFTAPDVVFGSGGKALVVWEDDRPDGTSQDIAGRLVGGRLFYDDFESGDMRFWSDVQ